MPRKPSLPISTMMAEYFLHSHDKILDAETQFFSKRFADDLDSPCDLKKSRFDLDILSSEHDTIKIINSPIRTLNTLSKSQGRKRIMTKFHRERNNSTEQENNDPAKDEKSVCNNKNGLTKNGLFDKSLSSVNGTLHTNEDGCNTDEQPKVEEKKQIFVCNNIPKDDFISDDALKENLDKNNSKQIFVRNDVPKTPIFVENNIPKQNGVVEENPPEPPPPKQVFVPIIPNVPNIPTSNVTKPVFIPNIPNFPLMTMGKQACANEEFNSDNVPKRDIIPDMCNSDVTTNNNNNNNNEPMINSDNANVNKTAVTDNSSTNSHQKPSGQQKIPEIKEIKIDNIKESSMIEISRMDTNILNNNIDMKPILSTPGNNPMMMHMNFPTPPPSLPINNNPNSQEEPETCPHCYKTFRRKGNFQKHLEREHGQIPLDRDMSGTVFKCPHCPYSTKHQSNLHVHKRVHTGERPYCCGAPYCGAKFTQGGSLKSHIKTQHDANMEYYKIERTKEGKLDLAMPSLGGWNPANPLLPLDAFLPGRHGHNGFLLSGSMMLGELPPPPPSDQVLDLSCDNKKLALEDGKHQKDDSKMNSKDHSTKDFLLPILSTLPPHLSNQAGHQPHLNPAANIFNIPVSGIGPNPLSIPLSPLPSKSGPNLLASMAGHSISSMAPLLVSSMPSVLGSAASVPSINMMMKMSMPPPPGMDIIEASRSVQPTSSTSSSTSSSSSSQQQKQQQQQPQDQQQQQSQKPKASSVNGMANTGLGGLHHINQMKIRPPCIPGCPNFEKLRNLRRNVVRLLTVLVPDLDLSRADLDCDSDNVDNLLHEVISTNTPMNYR